MMQEEMWEEREGETGPEATTATAVVWRLIPKAVESKAREVDPRLLKAIKSVVRSSDAEARAAVPALLSEMRKQSSQVRYLAILIIDELFMRSKLFRSLLVIKLDEFLSLSIGFRRNLPLPPPTSIASTLRSKSIELLEKWNNSFGIYYRQLRLGFDYLKNTLKFQFPNRLENETRLQQERREKEIRLKEILLKKFDNLKENYSSIKAEICSTIDETGECLDILHVRDDDFTPNIFSENDEVEEYKSLSLRQIRLESLKEGKKVHENSENKAIFDALRELHKLLVSKHLSAVKEWISVLLRVDLTDNKYRDAALKEFIDLSNRIQSVKKRCSQFDLTLDEDPSQEEEEDLWEEGTIDVNIPENSSAPSISVEESVVVTPTINKGKDVASPGNKKPSDGCDSGSTSERSKLLAEAPVMTWGPFLDDWGSSRDVLANRRGLELDGHWGRVDYDAVIPAERIAELNVHRTVYKEQPAEIQPCLAPLKKGGFCQRRDLKLCPFHGPIIPRDAEGNPIEPLGGETEKDDPTDQVSGSIDAESSIGSLGQMVEQLAKQAVKNVREGDRELKASKRAKLAKVREHNEAVLRDAALASTSYSEFSATTHEHETSAKEKNRIRMRKKGTTKDRLEERLLNTRVTDASINQLTQGEHAKYREAFPNQW